MSSKAFLEWTNPGICHQCLCACHACKHTCVPKPKAYIHVRNILGTAMSHLNIDTTIVAFRIAYDVTLFAGNHVIPTAKDALRRRVAINPSRKPWQL